MKDNINFQSRFKPMVKPETYKKASGFTLIEVTVTMAILGLIAAVAVPAYQSQKLKSYRSDAVILLTTASQMQERIRTENGAYTDTLTNLTPTGTTASPEGKYALSIENYSSETFTMVATATGVQLEDTSCAVFKISHTGVKSAEKSDSTGNASCWPR